MSDKKVFVVFGATGNQGGSVINSVLADPAAAQEFRIRGITRNPSSPNAQALAARGVECVTVNLVQRPFGRMWTDLVCCF